MRIAVTGGFGRLGAYVLRELVGHAVRVLDINAPAEPVAEDCSCFRAVVKKPLTPGCERVSVVKPQDLYIGHDQPRSFDHGQDLR